MKLPPPLAVSLAALSVPVAAQQPLFGSRHEMLPPIDEMTQAVVLVDVDGDADLDAFLGTGDGGKTLDVSARSLLLRNDGEGRFLLAAGLVPDGERNTRDAALGDVDGDGDGDLVLGNYGANVVYRNDAGVFAEVPIAGAPEDTTEAVALEDFDSDGDLDLFVGNRPQQNRFYRNDGGGGWTDATANVPVAADPTWDLGAGDLDGDGQLDVLVANVFDIALLANAGAGLFVDASAALPADTGATAIQVGDVDGDGDLDVVLPDRLYRNDGSGLFALDDAAVPDVPPGYTIRSIELGDLEADGDLDLFLAGGPYVNDGAGLFSEVAWESPLDARALRSIGLGDVDGDGDLDAFLGLVPTEAEPGRDALALGDGTGVLVDVALLEAPLPPIYRDTRAAAVGDLDGDGDEDVFAVLIKNGIGGTFEIKTSIYSNEGGGYFADVSDQAPKSSTIFRGVRLADADGDGDLDAFVGGHSNEDGGGGGVDLLLNDGAASFQYGDFAGTGYVNAFDVADVDADGDVDVAIANSVQTSITFFHQLWLNNGGGQLDLATGLQFPAYQDATEAIAFGDADGDGAPDLLFGNRPASGWSGLNRLFANDGSGAFAEVPGSLPASTETTRDLAWGDVDNDGDLDVLVGNDGANDLYLNDGSGAFVSGSAQLPANAEATSGLALGDFDADGDLDALLANAGPPAGSGSTSQLWRNDGGGVFTDASGELPVSRAPVRDVALGDFDADGDLDAFLARSGPSGSNFEIGRFGFDQLLSNRSRDLAWHSLPRVGGTLRLERCAPRDSFALLLYSPALGALDVGLGTFFLDPAQVFIADFAAPPSACVTTELPIPDLASLVGATVFFQDVYAAQSTAALLGFSNPERVPLTAL